MTNCKTCNRGPVEHESGMCSRCRRTPRPEEELLQCPQCSILLTEDNLCLECGEAYG